MIYESLHNEQYHLIVMCLILGPIWNSKPFYSVVLKFFINIIS